ncbi:MAG: prepilin-type N-terminal cleavage/methylation domain-containing protein [Acidobacteriota bacterium]
MKVQNNPNSRRHHDAENGFSLPELLISMVVFTIIMGSIMTLMLKSQRIFTTEQNAAEMNQNGRLLIDFLTRDIQQSKENALGLGPRFRSVYSNNGIDGKTDELTIISSDTETGIPSKALPLIPASTRAFNILDKFVELIPNTAGGLEAKDVVAAFQPDEQFIVSSVLQDGTIQFDLIKIKSAGLTMTGAMGVSFEPVEYAGIKPEVPFGITYMDGAFSVRPATIKRYFIDKSDKENPSLALSINSASPMTISSNITAFQLRYLEVKEGESDGQWVKEQNISSQYRTNAIEVTMTARMEDPAKKSDQMYTLATVIRPRTTPTGAFGNSGGGATAGAPGAGVNGGTGGGNGGGDGFGDGDGNGFGDNGGAFGRGNGSGYGDGSGSGDGGSLGRGGYNHNVRRIGKTPRLGEKLNDTTVRKP